MFLTKVGVLNWYSSMKNFFRKIQTIFDVEKWLWKSEICNFVTLSPLSEKVQKFFQCNFCDSTIVISFHQIPLTWWNAYIGPQQLLQVGSGRGGRVGSGRRELPRPGTSVDLTMDPGLHGTNGMTIHPATSAYLDSDDEEEWC